MTKSVILFLSVIVFFLFVGCASQHYYQLVETETGLMVNEGDFICFENSDIKISYNFWGNQGNGSFIVYNKTDVDLFIDLKRSHLIINGFAFTYFQDRHFATPKISFFSPATDEELSEKRNIKLPGISPKNVPPQSADVISFNEERIICIPPNSSQLVFGFDLQSEIFRDCQLIRFPASKQLISSEFDINSTPLAYRNRLTYADNEQLSNPRSVENYFWAKKITNFSEKDFVKYEYLKFCNDSSDFKITTHPYTKNSSFFFRYKLEPGRLNH